ncbi:hypothetical protein [Mariprofundus sp. EBB-1]|nr:hypothetical protein [Mariprofundus sp. EBB-1]
MNAENIFMGFVILVAIGLLAFAIRLYQGKKRNQKAFDFNSWA